MSSTSTADALASECCELLFLYIPYAVKAFDPKVGPPSLRASILSTIVLTIPAQQLNRWRRQQLIRSHNQQLQVLADSFWHLDSVPVLPCLDLRSYNGAKGYTWVVKSARKA